MSSGHKHPKVENSDVHVEVARRFVQHNQRYSSKRRAIVSMLETSDRPLTILEILQRSKSFKGTKNEIAQSSLYRNLVVLEEVGAVQRVVSTDDNGRYELNEEILGHHHHMLCSICGDGVQEFLRLVHNDRCRQCSQLVVRHLLLQAQQDFCTANFALFHFLYP